MGLTIISGGRQQVIGGLDWLRIQSGGVGVQTLINDAFTDTNGVLLSAHAPAPTNTVGFAWADLEGSCDIQSNQANPKTLVAAVASVVGDCTKSDLVLTASLIHGQATLNADPGLIVRCTDANNFWNLRIRKSDNTLSIIQVNAGVSTIPATVAFTVADNTAYAATVTLSGTNITFAVGATSVSYASSFNQSATKVGVRFVANGTITNNPRVDDFKVVG